MRRSSSQAARLRFRRRLDLTLSLASMRNRLSMNFFSSERFSGALSLRTVLAFLHGDIEHPMKLVFDSPVRTNCLGHFRRREIARGNVVALFHAGRLAFDLAHRINAGDDRTVRPIAFRHDAGRRQYRAALGHESTMPVFGLLDMDDLILAIKEGILNRLVQPGAAWAGCL